MFVRAYLRAATQEQDATRARAALEASLLSVAWPWLRGMSRMSREPA